MNTSDDRPILSFRDLQVQQRAIPFAKVVYALSARFPPAERFGLMSQVRRDPGSVSSNLAEGTLDKDASSATSFRLDEGRWQRPRVRFSWRLSSDTSVRKKQTMLSISRSKSGEWLSRFQTS